MIGIKRPFTIAHVKRFMLSPVNTPHGIGPALGGYDFPLIDGFDYDKYTLKLIQILTMRQNVEMIRQVFTGSKEFANTSKYESFKTDMNPKNRDPSEGNTFNPIQLDVGNICFSQLERKSSETLCISV